MVRRGFFAAALLTLAACSPSGGGMSALDIPDAAPGEISEDTMKDITRELSTDEFEGRMPGTKGEELTVALLKERFAAAGLQPGNNGSWVQEVPLIEITGRDYAPLTITGEGVDLSFANATEWVGVTYREDAETTLADSEMVFVGYGINAPERGWNDYEGLDVKGKTVVMLVNDPDWETQGLEGTFNGRAMTYYGRWDYKFDEAGRQGAAAALIIHETEPASYPWSVVEGGWSGPQGYPQRGDNPEPMTKINGWVSSETAHKLMKAAGQDLDALTKAAQTKGFKPVPLGLKASTSFQNDMRSFLSQNVIGVLPGTERPDEYVIHTAHWDHMGRCPAAPDGDDICNGAVDNATGTAALVALAEAHAKAGAPKRSLVFLAVTAEEQGLLGAKYYASNPVFPLAQTVAGINMDAFEILGRARDVSVVGGGKSQLDAFLEAALVSDGRTISPDSSPEAGYYYRSDHFAFARGGVPMFYVEGGKDLIDGGKERGKALAEDYRANRYHGPKDEFNEEWDWSGVMMDLQLFYRLGRMLSNSSSWPNWNEGDEFRATRDESCAASEKGC